MGTWQRRPSRRSRLSARRWHFLMNMPIVREREGELGGEALGSLADTPPLPFSNAAAPMMRSSGGLWRSPTEGSVRQSDVDLVPVPDNIVVAGADVRPRQASS